MCDYSLLGMPNRLASEGEVLQVHRFPTYSIGLASSDELQKCAAEEVEKQRARNWRERFINWFSGEPVVSAPAVCIPPGARLKLHGIPATLQQEFGVTDLENVTFTQLSATPHSYRDAIRFQNGREVLLQRLAVGQRVDIISLELEEEPAPIKYKTVVPLRMAVGV